MAIITSAATGPWSSTSTWTGGVLPGPLDTARAANGHIITIDMNVTVDKMDTVGSGSFAISGSTPISLTASLLSPATNTTATGMILFTSSYTASGTEIDVATITLGSHSSSAMASIVRFDGAASGDATVTVGTFNGGAANAGVPPGILSTDNGCTTDITINTTTINQRYSPKVILIRTGDKNIVINGDMTGTSSSTGVSSCLNISSGTAGLNIIVNGNIAGGSLQSSMGMSVETGSPTVTINGNITGGSGTNSTGATLYGSLVTPMGSYTINGNITGGSGAGTTGVEQNSNTSRLTVNGDLIGGSTSRGLYTAASAGTASAIINGNLIAGAGYGAHALQGVLGVTYVNGVDGECLMSTSGLGMPFVGGLTLNPSTKFKVIYKDDSAWPGVSGAADVHLSASGSGPDETDVREGTGYVYTTGSSSIPPQESVVSGVDVDDSTGTGLVRNSELAGIAGAQIASLSE